MARSTLGQAREYSCSQYLGDGVWLSKFGFIWSDKYLTLGLFFRPNANRFRSSDCESFFSFTTTPSFTSLNSSTIA